jgi:transposase-like protein
MDMVKRTKTAAVDRPLVASPQRSPDERSESGRSGGNATNGPATRGDVAAETETLERPKRRTFTAEYKLRVLQEADAATVPGAIGALLRREGLYSSLLTAWRRERAAAALAGFTSKKRGPQARKVSAEAKRVQQLEREVKSLRHRLKQAETIIEFQKKLNDVLGIPLSSPPGSSEAAP